ncbi:hypothetical protein MMIC_P0795 [Mariprofundus micogutta]|uniref:Uncharacterized protein n=1 Tax=Mariprofundus micogutta TaxID=1921010 RepID=A0A1L8CLP0_9PROT|nr:hypothetical protein [Mariprofundus micogutta]GAV19837.1 hypothetical protein MMIC_P0795 [Mariprofundus micogutta]
MTTALASETPVSISHYEFDTMLTFARNVFQLKDNSAYLQALSAALPETALIKTAWPSVLMGYDFHLTPDGPKLIEINNNAGGLYIGQGRWIPQPEIAELDGTLEQRLIEMFHSDWTTIAIMDEDVTGQFMYPEMQAYAELFEKDGRHVVLVSPEDLTLSDDGLFFNGKRIDAIYNRHTDFYLDTGVISDIRMAYERGQVAINPHPRSYALIGDKSRMVDWWREGLLEACIDSDAVESIRAVTPQTRQFSEMDVEQAWEERKQWVFKPAARHGGKGVVLGKAMSRKRFESLDREDTIVQQLVPASKVEVEGSSMKFDIRFYMHGEKLIALAGRVWRGQVTNFREPGSGWVSINIE